MFQDEDPEPPAHEPGFLYSTLNLDSGASQSEINERHRSLSLIFHPDKQREQDFKGIATAKFLDIQKAYQVLSDPFLRQVYDALGEDGLAIRWPEELHTKSAAEIKEILQQTDNELLQKKMKQAIHSQGKASINVDVSSLFAPSSGEMRVHSWPRQLFHRFQDTRVFSTSVVHAIQKPLNADGKTSLGLEARLQADLSRSKFEFMGTIRHQFSPRFQSSLSVEILNPLNPRFHLDFQDKNTTITLKGAISPLRAKPITANISISRKLFRRSFHRGKLSLNIGDHPQIAFILISPSPFNLNQIGLESDLNDASITPSISGFKIGTTHKSFGFVVTSGLPKLVAEAGVTFKELASRFTVGLELGFEGLTWVFSTLWSNETSEISATTTVYSSVVMLTLEFAYWEQRLSLPIILATDNNPIIALCTTVIPSTTMLFSYYFIIRPHRRARRLAQIKAARKRLEEDTDTRRERNAIESLLKDSARRQMEIETTKEGLIIVEAKYGVKEKEDGMDYLFFDVTIALQALVRNSQLYIRGGRTKAGVQGFMDPAPNIPKALRVRYFFRGRMHFAEIPDYLPVVLPLAEHRVDGCM